MADNIRSRIRLIAWRCSISRVLLALLLVVFCDLICASKDAVIASPTTNGTVQENTIFFSIRLGGIRFRIPSNYVGYATTEEKSLGENAGVTVHALLPDFLPESSTDRSSTESLSISIDRPMRRSASEELKNWKSGNQMFHVGKGISQGSRSGMEIRLGDRNTALSKTAIWDMYRIYPDKHNKAHFGTIFCSEITQALSWSRCRDAFVNRGLLIKLVYNRSHLDEWQAIRTKAIRKIDTWISKAN